MIDIETLGTGNNASILSIGACTFTMDHGIGDTFEVNIKPDGRLVDPKTVRWWLQQSKAAQEKLFNPEPIDQKDARRQFANFVNSSGTKHVWANGASFDLCILNDFYKGYPPWRYSHEMCMRSIRALGHMIGIPYGDFFKFAESESSVQHGALDDAIRQAKYVIAVFNKARGNG
jgi:DNA polymerase III epsilon subunit-like protein